ncbi:MAG: leucine-rich repeat domain-containing protein, partial [Muribaculaceae bacterium]|nr:leucine-rich repeat domain-containing protein [Muribaculaceae bacterium]
VGNPGTLSSLIADDESGTIKDLTLFGTLDANDFFFMRDNMRLSRLDISGVTISANGTNQANAIPREAFRGCSALKEVLLPNSVNRLNNGCFRQCGITSIVIPANVKTYEYNVFVAASALRDIWVGRETAEFINWCVLSGVKVDLTTLHVPSEKAVTNYSKAENWNTIKNIVVEKIPETTDALFAVQENNDVKFDASIDPGRVTPGQTVTFTAEYTAPNDNRMEVYANSRLLTPDAEGKYTATVNGNTIVHFELVAPTETSGKSQWTLTDANGSIGMLTDAVNVIPGQEFTIRLNALNIPQYFDQLYWAIALTDANDNIKEFISPVNVWSGGVGSNHKLNVNCCVNDSKVREGNKLRVVTSVNKKVWNVVEAGNDEIVASLPAINNMNPVYNITIPQVEGVNITGGVASAVRGRDITLKMVPVNPGHRMNVYENGKKIASNTSSLNHTFIALEDKEFNVEVFDPKAGGVAEFTVAPGTFHVQLTEQNVAETVVVRGQAYSLDIQAATGKDFAIKTIKTLDLSQLEIVKSGGYEANQIYHPFFKYTNGFATPASVVEKIILPNTLVKISGGIFENCANIEDITIPEGVRSVPEIGQYASGQPKYTYSIGDEAFKGLNKLTKIRIPGTPDSYNGEMLVAHHHPYSSTGSQYYSYYNLGHADPTKVTVIVPEEYLELYRKPKNNMYLGNPWKAHGYNILSEEPVYGVSFDPTRIAAPEDKTFDVDRMASFLGSNVPVESITVEKLRLANPDVPCKVFDNGNEVTLAEDGTIPVTFYNPSKNAELSGNHRLDVVYLHDVEFNSASSLFSVVDPAVENEAGYHFENYDAANPEAAVLRGVAENSTVKFGVVFTPEHAKGLELKVMVGQQEIAPDADGLYAVNVANASRSIDIFAVPGEGAVLNAEELNAIHEADAAGVGSIALTGELSEEEIGQAMQMFKNLESLDLSELESELPANAFAGMDQLTQVVLPEVETISAGLFSGCSSLQTIEIPASVNIVGEEAFKDCASLETIRLTGVTEIGSGAFDGCSSLTSLTILADNGTSSPQQARARVQRRVNINDNAFRGINPNCIIVLDEGVALPIAKANYLTTRSGLISEPQADGSVIEREGRIYSAGGDISFTGNYPLAIPHAFNLGEDTSVSLDLDLPSISGVAVPFNVRSITDADGTELKIALPADKEINTAAEEEDGPKAYIYTADAASPLMVAQTEIKANTPYIASLPGAGKYTFRATDGIVPSTPTTMSADGENYTVHSTYSEVKHPASEVYLLNGEGSAFEKAGDQDEETTIQPFGIYAVSHIGHDNIETGIYDANVETITEEVIAIEDLRIYREGNALVILSPDARALNVYATDGRLVRILDLNAGRNVTELPAKGIYIIGDRRILF